MTIFCLSQSKYAITLRAETEDVISATELVVAFSVIQRCLQTQVIVVIGIMETNCRLREGANVGVPSEGRQDAVGTVREKREAIAAEVVLAGTPNACEERMPVVNLPVQSRNGECKVNVWEIDIYVGVVLQTV